VAEHLEVREPLIRASGSDSSKVNAATTTACRRAGRQALIGNRSEVGRVIAPRYP